MTQTVAQAIAMAAQAIRNCRDNGNLEWLDKHSERLDQLVRDHLPSGSGFNSGTQFDEDASTSERLVFTTSFHHMNDVGYYDGWSDHKIIVRPTFTGLDIRVTGRNRADIKDYIEGVFRHALESDA